MIKRLGGGLQRPNDNLPCIRVSNTPSTLYFIQFFNDIYLNCKDFAVDLKEKKVLPLTNSALKILGSPLNLAYSLANIAQICLEALKYSLPWLKILSPIVATVYTGIEIVCDTLQLRHTTKISNELPLILEKKDFELLQEKLKTDSSFQKILGEKNIVEIKRLLCTHFIEGTEFPTSQIEEIFKTQLKKAKIIYSISLVCLFLSGLSIVVSALLAPPLVISSLAITAAVISTVRNTMIPAYLYQVGGKFSWRSAIPDWPKKIASTIVGMCRILLAKLRTIWTRCYTTTRDFGPLHARGGSLPYSSPNSTPSPTSSSSPQPNSSLPRYDRLRLDPSSYIPSSSLSSALSDVRDLI
jgi:hypothetical protein